MFKEIAIAGLLSSSVAIGTDASATPPHAPGAMTLASAVDAKCFAKAAAGALPADQADWWHSMGYGSAAEWFAAALGYAVAGVSADAALEVTRTSYGDRDQLDFKAKINGATLVLAATAAPNSAGRFAKTWRNEWDHNAPQAGVTWVSGKVKAKKKAVGSGASGTSISAGSVASIVGSQIEEFSNQLTLNAGAWSVAGSGSYAGLFDNAASAMGAPLDPADAQAASKALASAIANAVLFADVKVHYKSREGQMLVDKTRVSVSCGAGASATAEAFVTAD
jgi:hypothetical protein